MSIRRVRPSQSYLLFFGGLISPGSTAGEPESRAPGAGRSGTWAEGRILVLPHAGLPEKELAKIVGEHGGKARKIGQSDLYIVDLPGHGSEKAVAARLAHHPHLKFAELDYLVEPDFMPNDPQYGSAWHLPKIGASSAWDSSQGSGVTIAILDSGVDGRHPDLSSRMVAGWNFYDNNSITSDVFGHGTKVAGTASAITNNAVGVSGVAGQSKIMPVRVSGTNGSAYISTIAKGLTWAADNRARVANVSFNGVAGSASIQNASQYMKNKGGLVVVAAGIYKVPSYASYSDYLPESITLETLLALLAPLLAQSPILVAGGVLTLRRDRRRLKSEMATSKRGLMIPRRGGKASGWRGSCGIRGFPVLAHPSVAQRGNQQAGVDAR